VLIIICLTRQTRHVNRSIWKWWRTWVLCRPCSVAATATPSSAVPRFGGSLDLGVPSIWGFPGVGWSFGLDFPSICHVSSEVPRFGGSLDLGVPSIWGFPGFGWSLGLDVPSICHVRRGGTFWRLVGTRYCDHICMCHKYHVKHIAKQCNLHRLKSGSKRDTNKMPTCVVPMHAPQTNALW